jgi:arylsulfatase A-like enzyme
MAAAVTAAAEPAANTAPRADGRVSRPNIILYLSDQFRWDFLGANGLNGSTKTPNLDAMAVRGTNFTQAITNQPVCGPSRSVLMTSRYATETGVWHNDAPMNTKLPTVAGELRRAGYTANLIGKWHLAPAKSEEGGGPGYVKPEYRGGFLDLWEGANMLEHTTHPFEGTIYDGDGKEINFKDQYRVDFLTDRAEKFLRQKHEKPFFLFISQLEPHQQNDMNNCMVGPKGSADRFRNTHVPPDLRAQPGNWQQQLPDYYGCVEAIDASVGRVRKILEAEKLADNTIFMFMSDHGCHFMTRNKEYKRSTHNASIRVPLLMDGPGFGAAAGRTQKVDEIVGILDYAPTILDLAGVALAPGMRGKSMLPLLHDPKARAAWPKNHLVQISETLIGRALRAPEWTYCVADVVNQKTKAPASKTYREYQMYDQRNDPAELVNLAGREEYKEQATLLRNELKRLIVESGDPEPVIEAATLYP